MRFVRQLSGGIKTGPSNVPCKMLTFLQQFHCRLDESTTFASNLASIGLLPPQAAVRHPMQKLHSLSRSSITFIYTVSKSCLTLAF